MREDAEMERICEIQSFVVFSKSQHVLPQPIFKRSEAESEKERGFERDVVSFAVAKEPLQFRARGGLNDSILGGWGSSERSPFPLNKV